MEKANNEVQQNQNLIISWLQPSTRKYQTVLNPLKIGHNTHGT